MDMILRLLHSSIQKLRDPDKLFRNLLALSVEDERENEMIVAVFDGFSRISGEPDQQSPEGQAFQLYHRHARDLFRDLSQEFMVTEVIEKDFPESFRILRRFMLDQFTPELKKKIVHFLRNVDRTMIQELIKDLAGTLPYIGDEDVGRLKLLVRCCTISTRSRGEFAMRVEGINFEKRYLRTG